MQKTQSSLGSVCPPPGQKRKVYMARCPGCGWGPYVREIGGPALCSRVCEERLALKRLPKRTEKEKKKRKQVRKDKRKQIQNRRLERNEARKNDPIWQKAKALQGRYGYNFYTSPKWVAVRMEVLKESDGKCSLCGRSKREHGVTLHVDHIKPRSKHPSLELIIENLQVLCSDCNIGKGNQDETDWRTSPKINQETEEMNRHLNAIQKE